MKCILILQIAAFSIITGCSTISENIVKKNIYGKWCRQIIEIDFGQDYTIKEKLFLFKNGKFLITFTHSFLQQDTKIDWPYKFEGTFSIKNNEILLKIIFNKNQTDFELQKFTISNISDKTIVFKNYSWPISYYDFKHVVFTKCK